MENFQASKCSRCGECGTTTPSEGWLPISTSPQDGTCCVLWDSINDVAAVGSWREGAENPESWSSWNEHESINWPDTGPDHYCLLPHALGDSTPPAEGETPNPLIRITEEIMTALREGGSELRSSAFSYIYPVIERASQDRERRIAELEGLLREVHDALQVALPPPDMWNSDDNPSASAWTIRNGDVIRLSDSYVAIGRKLKTPTAGGEVGGE